MTARAWLRRLLREDDGQDLVEYALLAAFVGLAGSAALSELETSLGVAYAGWDTATQALWVMPEPGP
jgi:Flp pilus assembly pilin Flp